MRVIGDLRRLGGSVAALSLVGLLAAAVPAPAASAGPFASFAGDWIGGGDINMTDGSREKIRCKATYGVGPSGETLNINVNCASDSYRVNIISNVVAQGNSFSGTWRETTRQVNGDVTGRIPAFGQFQASLQGTGFGLELAATSNGKLQAITINAQGADVQNVKISLRRG